jgi:hypothetical protein
MRWGLIDKIPTRPNYSRQVYSRPPRPAGLIVFGSVVMVMAEEICFVWWLQYTCRNPGLSFSLRSKGREVVRSGLQA